MMTKDNKKPKKISHQKQESATGVINEDIGEVANNDRGGDKGVIVGGQSITLVAQSVASLAQAVKNLQVQLQSIDERIQSHELQLQTLASLKLAHHQNENLTDGIPPVIQYPPHSSVPSLTSNSNNINNNNNNNNNNDNPCDRGNNDTTRYAIQKQIENDQKKKQDFVKAYKSVVSIVKALKVLPEIKQLLNSHQHHQQEQGTMVPSLILQNTDSNNQNATTMLRNIALTLSDVDTIGSYVSNNNHHYHEDNLTFTDDLTSRSNTQGNKQSQPQILHHHQQQQHQDQDQNMNNMDMVLVEKILKKHSNHSFYMQLKLTLLCCCVIIALNIMLYHNNLFHGIHHIQGNRIVTMDDSNDNNEEIESRFHTKSHNSTATKQLIQEVNTKNKQPQVIERQFEDSGVLDDEGLEDNDCSQMTQKLSLQQHKYDNEMIKSAKDLSKRQDTDISTGKNTVPTVVKGYDDILAGDVHEDLRDKKLKLSLFEIVANSQLCNSYEDSAIISTRNFCN